MFEKASRLKLRFDTNKGQLSIEDLWDLPLTSNTGKANLDDIARGLFQKLKSDNTVSFVKPEQKSDQADQLAFDIVKHIIDVRVAERDAASLAAVNREKKQKLLELIEQKENTVLSEKSLDELKAMAASL